MKVSIKTGEVHTSCRNLNAADQALHNKANQAGRVVNKAHNLGKAIDNLICPDD